MVRVGSINAGSFLLLFIVILFYFVHNEIPLQQKVLFVVIILFYFVLHNELPLQQKVLFCCVIIILFYFVHNEIPLQQIVAALGFGSPGAARAGPLRTFAIAEHVYDWTYHVSCEARDAEGCWQ